MKCTIFRHMTVAELVGLLNNICFPKGTNIKVKIEPIYIIFFLEIYGMLLFFFLLLWKKVAPGNFISRLLYSYWSFEILNSSALTLTLLIMSDKPIPPLYH